MDEERSGKDTRRPGYQSMKSAAERRAFDVVLVEAVDRLTRKVKDAINTRDLLSFQDIRLVSIQEGEQDVMKVLFAGFGAQMFSQKIADHTKRGMQGAITRFRLHTSAYGYRKREVEHGLNREIDPAEAAIVRRIFEEYTSGKSTKAIAAGLNAGRMPAPKGGTWESTTIRGSRSRQDGILRNRLYTGMASVCRNTHTYHPETGAKRIKPSPQDMIEQEIPDLRIIAQPLWDEAQAELSRRAAPTPKAARKMPRRRHLLSGLMICGCCGANVVKYNKAGFRCGKANKGACGNRKGISRRRLEQRVFDALRAVFQSEEMRRRFVAEYEAERAGLRDGTVEADLSRLEARRVAARRGLNSIMTAIAEGARYATFKAKAEALQAEVDVLTARIAEKQARIATQASVVEDPSQAYDLAVQQMEDLLSEVGYVDEANTYLSMLIKRITLTENTTAQHGVEIRMNLANAALLPENGAGGTADGKAMTVKC
ncbi:recombinase family protein [Mameliella sp.]|uniref:recombinase family protein n=1 Tax=Mameliella sp. TaxID=1924940 RepID=UPI003BAA15B8